MNKNRHWEPGEIRHVSDVLLNGESVMHLIVQEAFVSTHPHIQGWVLLQNRLPDDAITDYNKIVDGEQIIDGQVLTIPYYGNVEVIP